MVHLVALSLFEGSHAFKHLVPVDKTSVKLGAVNAYEACLSANGQSASATHACAVYHDGVERHLARYVVLLCQERAKLHHDGWSDSKNFVYMFLLHPLVNALCHETFLSIRAVVGHYCQPIAAFAHLILQDNEVFASSCNDRQHTVSGCLERTHNGQHWSHAHAASCTHHGTEVFDVSGVSQRSYHVSQAVALLHVAQLCRRKAHLLHNDGYRSFLRVGVGYC